jgi:hypothetical protein
MSRTWMFLPCALVIAATPALAFDRGQYAQTDDATRQWFDGLQNQRRVPCCSTADGTRVEDADWRRDADGGYSVRLNGEWIAVPPDALVTVPNRVGYAVVWIWQGRIQCFMRGVEG